MTTEELREIDGRVALAIGGTLKGWPMGKGPFDWWRPGHLPVPLPHFTTDPAAADLVRLEIERRGYGYRTIKCRRERGWSVWIWGGWGNGQVKGESYASPHHALCLAFLAAIEAEATQ